MHTSRDRRLLFFAAHTALIPLAIVTLIPFVWLALAALKTPEDFSGSVFLPKQPEVIAETDGRVERIERVRTLHPEEAEAARTGPTGAHAAELELSKLAIVVRADDGAVTEHRVRSDAGLAIAEGDAVAAGDVLSSEFVDLRRLTFDNFVRLFTDVGLGRAIVNSVFLASTTAVLATLCAAAGGYALARFRFRGRRVMTLLVLAAVIIPPPLLLAPSYQLLYHLGLLDTFSGLILPAIAPAFGIFLFRQAAMQGVPESLIEAARIDGATEIGIFTSVVLPLVRPMIGAFMLLTFLAVWNNFIGPQVVLQSEERYPLSVAVAQMRGLYRQDYGLLMAGTLVSVLPVAGLFLLLQREFIQGLTSGAVKG